MSEEEIDLRELLMLFWKKRIFICTIIIIFSCLGIINSLFIRKPTYTSTSSMIFGKMEKYQIQDGEKKIIENVQDNTSIINDYKKYILSKEILEQTINELELNNILSIGELRENIKISTENSSLIVNVSGGDKSITNNVANKILEVFGEKAKEFYQIDYTYAISEANDNTIKATRRRVTEIGAAFLLGVCCAFSIIVLKYLFDPRISSEKNIEEKMEIPVISKQKMLTLKNGKVVEDIENSEQFKVLRANIEFSIKNSAKNKLFFITSPNENDGKTFVAANLAVAYAEVGKKVLVIDTDKKDGNLDNVLDVRNEYGLSNYLLDSNKISNKDSKKENNLIQESKIANLHVVTIGDVNGKKFEIIQNDKFIKFLNDMKEKYDIIIMDGAEMISYADSRFLSNISDQTILVGRLGKTKEQDMIDAKKEIKKINGNLLGVVLNYK